MATQVQLRRGTTSANDSFKGVEGELVYDIEKKQLRIHDGVTVGGNEIKQNVNYEDIENKPVIPTKTSELDNDAGFIASTTKGIAGGVATLDENGKIPLTQLNESFVGGVSYKGMYDAGTNTPDLSVIGKNGEYYIISGAGFIFGKEFGVGDWIISNGTSWDKIDNTSDVLSVNGRTGNVIITAEELDLSAYATVVDLNKKQDKLTAGTGIKIDGGVISNTKTETTIADVNGLQSALDSKQVVGDYALKNEIPVVPVNVSELTNDSGFITADYHDSSKQDVLTLGDGIDIDEDDVISVKFKVDDVQVNGTTIVVDKVANIQLTASDIAYNTGDVATTLLDLNSDIAGIESDIENIQTAQTAFDTRLGNDETLLTAHGTLLAGYDKKITDAVAKADQAESAVDGKQDKIDDLDTIRIGAGLGATALQSVKTINSKDITGDGNVDLSGTDIKAVVDGNTDTVQGHLQTLNDRVQDGASVSLDNLDATGQAKFDAKADKNKFLVVDALPEEPDPTVYYFVKE